MKAAANERNRVPMRLWDASKTPIATISAASASSPYAETLYKDDAATLDDLREAVTRLEETARIARRVFGGAHPITEGIERTLRDARAALRAQEAVPK